jgi:hypothetical protein
MTDQQKEQIRFNTEMIKLLAVLLFGTGGGSITLIVDGVNSGKKVIFTAVGIIMAITCFILIYMRYGVTQKIINDGRN